MESNWLIDFFESKPFNFVVFVICGFGAAFSIFGVIHGFVVSSKFMPGLAILGGMGLWAAISSGRRLFAKNRGEAGRDGC